jgi:hypothetical protein
MTQIGFRPILSIRVMTRIARRTVNGQDTQNKNGVKYKHTRKFSPENRARYDAVVAENKRLAVPYEPRLDVFLKNPSLHRKQHNVPVARSKADIAARNRALLVAIVAAKARKAAAKIRKQAIDAAHPKGETHRTSHTERWKNRPRPGPATASAPHR